MSDWVRLCAHKRPSFFFWAKLRRLFTAKTRYAIRPPARRHLRDVVRARKSAQEAVERHHRCGKNETPDHSQMRIDARE
jgi:hypothetical protein